ncbi:helix-turn-helix transcriptional regulator [Curtobacterium caseinilyticum]|uniref:Helix-turn-helix transcriptional regulator n=1 Tax=Curtobacterium caseinilyticum TaxID=3055137 RepID=A0ABT7TMS6_9MICO|nr:AraC family transcriptional regulator [Curtobacterium caseinilyticum]MDM7890821.1 helix-turn-helix transcriptional regulator [Curtobacterium caseinilyticum]
MVSSLGSRGQAEPDRSAPSTQDPQDARRGGRAFRRLVGTDVDEALSFFGGDYDFRAPRVRRTRQRPQWDFAGVGDDRMSLRSSRFYVDLRTESVVDDQFIVAWLRSGSSTITFGGRSVQLEPGVPVVLPDAYELHHRDIGLNLVQLDRAHVRAVVGDPEFTFDPMRRPTAEGIRVWQAAVRAHTSTWLDVEHELGPAAERTITDAFVTAAVEAFPRRDRWQSAVRGSGPEHDRLRRALEFVHAHARDPIGTPEIAAAAGLSARGLQQSLRRHLDQTPGDLLRGVRLDGARADLLRGDRDATSVADIARSWGFGHLGRFSATYRERFGELPSESLRAR